MKTTKIICGLGESFDLFDKTVKKMFGKSPKKPHPQIDVYLDDSCLVYKNRTFRSGFIAYFYRKGAKHGIFENLLRKKGLRGVFTIASPFDVKVLKRDYALFLQRLKTESLAKLKKYEKS